MSDQTPDGLAGLAAREAGDTRPRMMGPDPAVEAATEALQCILEHADVREHLGEYAEAALKAAGPGIERRVRVRLIHEITGLAGTFSESPEKNALRWVANQLVNADPDAVDERQALWDKALEFYNSEEITVNGNVYRRDQLRSVLARALETRDEARREAKRQAATAEALRAELEQVRRAAHNQMVELDCAISERYAYKQERDALAARIDAVRALPPEPRCDHDGDCSDWSHGWDSGRNATLREVGRVIDGEPPLRDYSKATRPPAQEPRSRHETVRGSTDRGTGVGRPHGRPEAVRSGQGKDCPHRPEWHCEDHGECRGCECGCDTVNPELDLTSAHWLKWDTIARTITGCQCGFAADIDSDCGFGDSVVRHLLEVGAEAAAPDVDGWTLYGLVDGGVLLSHDTDADRPTLRLDSGSPLGAVLAFIADQEGHADER